MKNYFEALVLACLLGVGFSLVEVTIPDSGSTIVGDEGDEDIQLFCNLTLNGNEQATVWSIMMEGQTTQSTITVVDPAFNITGEPIPGPGNFSFNANLTILELTADLNNAIIYCGVSGNLLAANFTIRLYTPPSLIDLGVMGLAEGDVAPVDLSDPTQPEAFPLPAGEQVTWTMGGSVVSSDGRVAYGYPAVTFDAVERGDAGDYTLTAFNTRSNGSEIGRATGSFTLDVYFGPSIVDGDDRVPVAVGGDVTLLCGSDPDGNPAPVAEWRDNNGTVVSNGGRYSIVSDSSEVSLTIQGVTANDAGDWQCSLTVEAGSRTIGTPVVRDIALFVVVPASAPTGQRERGIDGTSVLVCWQEPADVGTAGIARYRIRVDPADVGPIDTPDNSTDFNVTGLMPVTDYQFRVQAVSEYEGVVVLSDESDPANATTGTSVPAPVCDTAPVSDRGVIAVTWDYTHTGGLNLTEVIVQYGISSDDEIDFQDIPDGNLTDVDEVTLDVRGLVAGRAYVFQITATNDVGSATVQCPPVRHTVGVPQTPVVESIEPTPDVDGDIVVNVVIPSVDGFDDIPADLVTFTVVATLQPDGTMTSPVMVTVSNYFYGNVIMVMVSGLMVGQDYVFTVSASNMFGDSDTSESVPMEIVDATTATTTPTTEPPEDEEEDDDNTAAIAGGVIGAIIGVVLIFLIVLLIVYLVMRHRDSGSYKVEGGERSGVKIEEVEIDIGNELQESTGTNNADKDKELHYAELETLTKKPPVTVEEAPKPTEEPVQYAVIQPPTQPEPKPAEEPEQGEGDKSQTSTTLV